ncbi:MAG TPA: nucleotidyltransferase family protein [Candidatus Diapherotrites archaeon]|uniref:Nucleotidyltransferase family protein n=1 Tax=Candidatus Iainarchaeum sp. TaxID=3101447 RepID=A0A7J4JJC2_9ARCH|nr:nucleotidyltransferase family protein [Candidatus Diapherotrites archaeon]HIH16037.1 nucleotidyltransferase family protein [Candidatus Diapherotrites archaeon]
MKAVILAGGKGERLRPLTQDTPKVMLPVAGKPLLEWLVEGLVRHGIQDLLLCVSHQREKISDYFGYGERFKAHITYSVDPEFLGTAGSVRQLESQPGETFLVVYGDVASRLDYSKLIAFHQEHGGLASLVLHPSDHPADSDLAELDSQNRITFFGRKAAAVLGGLTNAGCYVLEPAIFKGIPHATPLDFGRDVFPALVKAAAKGASKPLYGFVSTDYMRDIGTLERYKQVKEEFGLDRQ